jgi:hypothetical protein
VSEFAFVQALRLSLSAATRASRRGDHENDNRATKDEGLPAAEATQAQFQALVSRMTDLPNPHPTARVTFRPVRRTTAHAPPHTHTHTHTHALPHT